MAKITDSVPGQPGNLISLIYLSSATVPFSKQELIDLLAKSRENNSRLGVTGMLLFKEGKFLQALEGEEETVTGLYNKISLDPRHDQCMIVSRSRLAGRDFPDWSMGFQDLATADVLKVPGFSSFLDTPLNAANFASDPPWAKKLLLLFKEEIQKCGSFAAVDHL
jgi:hypothetical protein